MNLLEHSPDLVMSTVYLHMKEKRASWNINNIPVADVLAFYSGVTISFFPLFLSLSPAVHQHAIRKEKCMLPHTLRYFIHMDAYFYEQLH